MSIVWTYNGVSAINVTFASTVGHNYDLFCSDPSSSGDGPVAGTGGDLTLSVGDIGGLTTGQTFIAELSDDDSGDAYAVSQWTIGSTSLGGVAATWSYDGDKTVQVTFTSTLGTNYRLLVTDHSGIQYQDAVGIGSNLTITVVGAATFVGSYFDAQLNNNDVGTGMGMAIRLFQGGVASSGTDGGGTVGVSAPQGVCIAFGNQAFAALPSWTRLDV